MLCSFGRTVLRLLLRITRRCDKIGVVGTQITSGIPADGHSVCALVRGKDMVYAVRDTPNDELDGTGDLEELSDTQLIPTHCISSTGSVNSTFLLR